ncbi:MAG TPA: hypothetical protein VLI04_19340, partial [Nocardioidaceae bacterium]|nr:hypothetical protein [Nocardioidaceae bacterium]
VFAISAGARSTVQIATKLDEAPAAYLLSLGAALIYLVASVALRLSSDAAWRVAVGACTVELAGILVVGTLSLAQPEAFPDQTVWSDFGIGYGFIPIVLPVVGLVWLLRNAPLNDEARL